MNMLEYEEFTYPELAFLVGLVTEKKADEPNSQQTCIMIDRVMKKLENNLAIQKPDNDLQQAYIEYLKRWIEQSRYGFTDTPDSFQKYTSELCVVV